MIPSLFTPTRPRVLLALSLASLTALAAATSGAATASTPPSTEPAATVDVASTIGTETTVGDAPFVTSTTVAPTTVAPTTVAPTTTEAAVEVTRWPLTGVAVEGEYTPRPALVVKIDDGVNSKPQTGLNQADIVFEEIVEGRVTRFAAVFNSTDSDPVGNIRSGRTQDPILLGALGVPIFAYSGGNEGVNAALGSSGFVLLTEGDGMFRVSGRGGPPYNLYGNTSDLFARGIDRGGATDAVALFEYDTEDAGLPGATPATGIDVGIGSVSVRWDFDAEQGLYLRTENGSDHQQTDGQVSTNNVVVLVMPYGTSAAASNSPEARSTGTGRAVMYRNGLAVEGTWTRESASDTFTLVDASGSPMLLTPGRTFVELVDADGYSLEAA